MQNKSIKHHAAKILLSLGGIATLVESCDKNYYRSLTSEDFAPDSENGYSLLPVKYYIPEEANIQGIIHFTNDILSNPTLKTSFSENPEAVLKQYGLENYDRESPQIQIILASGDADVMRMIKEKDFKGYLRVLEEKNYLQTEVIQEIKRVIDSGMPIETRADTTVDFVLAIPVAVVAAVVVLVAAAMSVAAWAHVAAYVELTIRGLADDQPIFSDDAIILYLDETKRLDTIGINEEEYVSQIREAVLDAQISDPEQANQVFQLGCGTVEHLIQDNEE